MFLLFAKITCEILNIYKYKKTDYSQKLQKSNKKICLDMTEMTGWPEHDNMDRITAGQPGQYRNDNLDRTAATG